MFQWQLRMFLIPQQREEVIELDFAELEQMIDQELSNEEDPEDMVDRHEYAEEELETDEGQDDLQESDEIDLELV